VSAFVDDAPRDRAPAGRDRARVPDGLVEFGGLRIERRPGVLEPRPWTLAQSRWAARLARSLPAGPVLELHAGGGQIGLEVARLSGRHVVQVDRSVEACEAARANADGNGLGHRVTVRNLHISAPLGRHDGFAIVLADPPYVPSGEVGRFPDDPITAIDGGDDGLAGVREVIDVVPGYLRRESVALVQVRGRAQAEALAERLRATLTELRMLETRTYGPDRAIVALALQ
jgi:methylase of polypeptide subunit release factors